MSTDWRLVLVKAEGTYNTDGANIRPNWSPGLLGIMLIKWLSGSLGMYGRGLMVGSPGIFECPLQVKVPFKH